MTRDDQIRMVATETGLNEVEARLALSILGSPLRAIEYAVASEGTDPIECRRIAREHVLRRLRERRR